MNITAIYEQLFKSSIHRFKQKNSAASIEAQRAVQAAEAHTIQGGIFAVRQKEDFASTFGVKGMILTSIEALMAHRHSLSHFTPNPYVSYKYSDPARTHITGFSEEQLLQINTFVVDIDTKRYSVQDIVLTAMDESIGMPTFIVESTRGYQLYFVLEQPFYLSTEKKSYSLHIAKRIAQNLKNSLQSVEADIYCNDFGFFRLPTENNIRFCQLSHVYDVAQLIDWSMRIDDDEQRLLYAPKVKATRVKVTEQPWFQAVIQATHLRGHKGKIGRNNAIFTLALACYQDQFSFEQTYNLLDEWNSMLHYPLNDSEVRAICRSAYSGKYNGPKKAYIEQLLANYVDESIVLPQLSTGGWYKHKKDRQDRVRSHLSEWEADLVAFIESRVCVENPYVQMSQKQLCNELRIPKSTLNKLLNHTTLIVRKTTGAGRNAVTSFSTTAMLTKHFIHAFLQAKQATSFIAFMLPQLSSITTLKAKRSLESACYDIAYLIDHQYRRRSRSA